MAWTTPYKGCYRCAGVLRGDRDLFVARTALFNNEDILTRDWRRNANWSKHGTSSKEAQHWYDCTPDCST